MTAKEAADKSSSLRVLVNIGTVLGVLIAFAGVITYNQGQLSIVEDRVQLHEMTPTHYGVNSLDISIHKDMELIEMRVTYFEREITAKLDRLLERESDK